MRLTNLPQEQFPSIDLCISEVSQSSLCTLTVRIHHQPSDQHTPTPEWMNSTHHAYQTPFYSFILNSKQAAKICLNVYFCLSKCTVHVQMGNIQNDTISEELFWPLHWRRLGLVIIKAVITERGLYAPRCATCGRQPTSKTYRLTVMNFMSINNLKSWQSNKITNRNAYTTSVPRDLLPCNQSISMATPTSPWRHHTPSLHDGQRLTQWPNAQNLLANCTYRKIGIKSTMNIGTIFNTNTTSPFISTQTKIGTSHKRHTITRKWKQICWFSFSNVAPVFIFKLRTQHKPLTDSIVWSTLLW